MVPRGFVNVKKEVKQSKAKGKIVSIADRFQQIVQGIDFITIQGILSVNTISVNPDSCTRKEAGSDITQWLAIARTDLAPASIMILTAYYP